MIKLLSLSSAFSDDLGSAPGPLSDFWYADPLAGGGANYVMRTRSGVSISENAALNYSAVWAATRIITELTARLPLHLYRRLGNDDRERLNDHPLTQLVHTKPNTETTAFPFRVGVTSHQVNRGNGYCEIERSISGIPLWLWPLQHCRPMRNQQGELRYRIEEPGQRPRELLPEDVLHVRGVLTCDGIVGKGVIQYARESIGMGLATERYGASLFGNGANPSVVLKHPGNPGEEEIANLRRSWREIYGGVDLAGGTAVIENGMDIVKLSLNADDAQFLETRQHNITEIARWYLLPPHKLAHLVSATFNNVELLARDFVDHVMPWLILWEQELNAKLLTDQERTEYYFEHDLNGLLAGDSAARSTYYRTMFGIGAISINTICRKEGLPSAGPEGDQRFVPLNMVTLERAASEEYQPSSSAGGVPGDGNSAPPYEPGPADNQSSESLGPDISAAINDARTVVMQIMRVMAQRERKDILRAATQPNKFLASVDDFYSAHRDRIANALAAPLSILASLRPNRIPTSSELLADRIVSAHKQDCLEACECGAGELMGRVSQKCDEWCKSVEDIAWLD